jgi:hypothetical protein
MYGISTTPRHKGYSLADTTKMYTMPRQITTLQLVA